MFYITKVENYINKPKNIFFMGYTYVKHYVTATIERIRVIRARQYYNLIVYLFQWASIEKSALLYRLNYIFTVYNEIKYFFLV